MRLEDTRFRERASKKSEAGKPHDAGLCIRRCPDPSHGCVQAGETSCEQLKLAVFLRSLTPSALAESADLAELKQRIWNEIVL